MSRLKVEYSERERELADEMRKYSDGSAFLTYKQFSEFMGCSFDKARETATLD